MSWRNILSSRVVIPLFLLSAALYFGRGIFGCTEQWWMDFTKALPVALLGITTWFAGGNKMLPIALLLSACGDIAGEHGAFLWQIGLFAIAHIAFILYFSRKAKVSKQRLTMVALWGLIMLLFGGFILFHIDNTIIRIACSIYILIIGSMTAATLLIESKYRWCYIIGALIFVFSDSCIAWNRFVEHFEGAGIAIMTTYFAAQLIFATLYLNDKK
ncbi:MAG: lysoplasmalogenase [Alistipes sp.]|nr:lysoplasmalogenase [Alistipes sp.]